MAKIYKTSLCKQCKKYRTLPASQMAMCRDRVFHMLTADGAFVFEQAQGEARAVVASEQGLCPFCVAYLVPPPSYR